MQVSDVQSVHIQFCWRAGVIGACCCMAFGLPLLVCTHVHLCAVCW
jgi:hypothetical protein